MAQKVFPGLGQLSSYELGGKYLPSRPWCCPEIFGGAHVDVYV